MSVSPSNSPTPLSDRLAALSARGRFGVFAGLGALGALGHPPVGLPILTIVALLALFWLKPWTLAPRAAAWAGWAFGLGHFAVTLHWLVEPFLVDIARHGWMAPFAIALMAGGLALFWGAAFWVGAWRRSGLVMAIALAAAELARAHVFTGFPWGMHVTAFVDVQLYQGAAWLGPYGLTAALYLIVALSARTWATLAVGGAVLAILSLAPVAPAPKGDGPIVRVVQPNAEQHLKWVPEQAPIFLNRQLEATAALPGAELVIWPEVALTTWLENASGIFGEAARRGQGAAVLIGAQSYRDGKVFNALAHVDEAGQMASRYDKAHLVPFGEYMPLGELFSRMGIYGLAAGDGYGFAAGDGGVIFHVEGVGPVLPLICYESIFAHDVRRLDFRPRMIAIVTNDAWFGQLGGPAQHLQHAQARAIELGLPVARSANTGISAIIDAKGRIVSSLGLGETGHVDARLPAPLPPTFYALTGDLGLMVLIALVLLGHVALRRLDLD
ncbi:MAG: apolipoprotein N-acyltransferase [Pseudomonadota bacterium]